MFNTPFFNIPFNKSSPQNNSLSNQFENIKLHIKYAKINLPTFLKSSLPFKQQLSKLSKLSSMSIVSLSKLSILKPLPFLKSKLSSLFKQSISILPPSTKPFTIIFDINTLAIKRFNWYTLQHEYTLKPYTEEMLFTLGYNNEIILISNINEDIINRLDPYGFIKYRYNIKNTQLLNILHINRDMNKTIIIAQEEINKEFYNNTLIINNIEDYNRCYSGEDNNYSSGDRKDYNNDRKDYNNDRRDSIANNRNNHNNNHTLTNNHINNNINLNLIHFISTLNILNKDYPTIILSYKNKDFLSNFRITQLKYFKNKSLLDKQKYIEMLNEINKQRIEEYDNAKPYMEEQLIKDKMLNNKYIIDKIGYIVKGLLFSFI
ncbi:hypothetical protein SLOPH_1798 [Spraguea lophii 42_110]|uniref:Mitochondrial import inner membrane translocase subunit TIM50 n=1 Tax=Spraguea lophii (strain 42_110) TaxID=1358809 RepID=S7W7W5_SPRLO|nr:hypothetical protein SLOPH_1798 [Spraguea lophii 42_110]